MFSNKSQANDVQTSKDTKDASARTYTLCMYVHTTAYMHMYVCAKICKFQGISGRSHIKNWITYVCPFDIIKLTHSHTALGILKTNTPFRSSVANIFLLTHTLAHTNVRFQSNYHTLRSFKTRGGAETPTILTKQGAVRHSQLM